jgi:hypothetical protein
MPPTAAQLVQPNWPAFHLEAIENLRDRVRTYVAGGFMEADDIAESAIHYLSDDYDVESLRPYAKWMTDHLIEIHITEQLSWPEVTDCDRLDMAFAEWRKTDWRAAKTSLAARHAVTGRSRRS